MTLEGVASLGSYLHCIAFMNDKSIKKIRDSVLRTMQNRVQDSHYIQFMDWQRKSNELAVLTMYAYDDIVLPVGFDIVFQISKPDNFIYTPFLMTQAIISGWAAVDHLSRGHTHVSILEFDREIPEIFKLLHEIDSRDSDYQNDLGFCSKNDFASIITGLKKG